MLPFGGHYFPPTTLKFTNLMPIFLSYFSPLPIYLSDNIYISACLHLPSLDQSGLSYFLIRIEKY